MLKYPSLKNHYNILKSRKLMSVFDELFYATEKIHGSNMSIEITKDSIKYFSRNREVTLDDGAMFYEKDNDWCMKLLDAEYKKAKNNERLAKLESDKQELKRFLSDIDKTTLLEVLQETLKEGVV